MRFIEILKENSIKYKDKFAFVDTNGDRDINYADFWNLSNKIKNKIDKLNIKKGSAIIIKLGRKYEFIASEVGILKADCTFVPTLPEYPKERIEYIKNDSNAKYIIDESFFDDINNYSSNCEYNVSKEGLAMILYTSGSTGNPKGVCWPKISFDETVERAIYIYKPYNELRFAASAAFTFVASYQEVFGIIASGGTTHIIDNNMKLDVNKLSDYYDKYKITCGYIPQSLFRYFKQKGNSIKMMITGSEKVVDLYTDEYKLLNLYGQTEGWMYTTFYIDKSYKDSTPIGKPLPGIEIRLLDENGKEVKDGEEGEICAVGHLSSGYMNLPVQTKKTYEDMPDGRVLIHSGDLGKYDENGNLLYVNRKDFMIKLNGQRIEPGEVETVMNTVEGITGSVVKVFTKDDNTTILCGFYTSEKEIDKSIIHNKLKEKLALYMIPTIFIHMDKFPTNQNGKLDRKNILLPENLEIDFIYEKPINEVEEKICKAFEKLFKKEKISRNANFYELGGNSINASLLSEYSNIKGMSPEFIMGGETPKEIALIYEKHKNNLKPQIKKREKDLDIYKLSVAEEYYLYDMSISQAPIELNDFRGFYLIDEKVDIDKLLKCMIDTIKAHKAYFVNFDFDKKIKYIGHNNINEPKKIKIKEEDFEQYRRDKIRNVRRDVKKDVLYDFEVLYVDKDIFIHINMNHMIYDGASIPMFFNEINERYKGNIPKKENLDIFDLAIYDEEVRKSSFYDEALKYFDNLYKDLPEKINKKWIGAKSFAIKRPEEINYKILEKLFIKNKTQESIFLQAVAAKALAKCFNRDNITYKIMVDGRENEGMKKLQGGYTPRGFFMVLDTKKYNSMDNLIKEIQKQFKESEYYSVVDVKLLVDKYKNLESGIMINIRGENNMDLKVGDNIYPFLPIGYYYDDFLNYAFINLVIDRKDGRYMIGTSSGYLNQNEMDNWINIFMKTLMDFYNELLNK